MRTWRQPSKQNGDFCPRFSLEIAINTVVALRAVFWHLCLGGLTMRDQSLGSLAAFGRWDQRVMAVEVAISEPRRFVWMGDGIPADSDAMLVFLVQMCLLCRSTWQPVPPNAERAWDSFYPRCQRVLGQVIGKACRCRRFGRNRRSAEFQPASMTGR